MGWFNFEVDPNGGFWNSSLAVVRPVTVLIADAQPLFADAMAMALSKFPEIHVLAETPMSGLDTEQEALRLKPEILLLDYWIKGMDAVALIRRVLSQDPGQKIVLLSWFHSPGQIAKVIAAGACAALSKSATLDELVQTIRKVALGAKMVLASTPEGHPEVRRLGRDLLPSVDFPSLTPKEIQVLELLARGLSPARIASELSIKLATVRTHINNILRKTEAESALEAIVLAVRSGLVR